MSYFEDNILFIKIRRADGLYSKGGRNADTSKHGWGSYSWSKRGKMWQTIGSIKNHLIQYCEWNYTKGYIKNNIPKDWVVEVMLKNKQMIAIFAYEFYPRSTDFCYNADELITINENHNKKFNKELKELIEELNKE